MQKRSFQINLYIDLVGNKFKINNKIFYDIQNLNFIYIIDAKKHSFKKQQLKKLSINKYVIYLIISKTIDFLKKIKGSLVKKKVQYPFF